MDIISHGLWGGAAFGRKKKKDFWLAFIIGMMPDALSFGAFTIMAILGLASGPDWKNGIPDPSLVPSYIYYLYNITHSLIIFTAVFLLIWLIRKKPLWIIGVWGLHILIDIPSHSSKFFPTPFLWPISDFKINGIGWGNPEIFLPNIILLAIFYIWFFARKRKKN